MSQPEIPADWSGVTLEPYLDYSLNADGYPASLIYSHSLSDQAALVACAFKLNGQYYRDPANPVVRFTSVDGTADRREQLTLLNYAGHFSVGSPNWYYASDNVFTTINDRGFSDRYGSGYNVLTPRYPCDTGNPVSTNSGPCGTFVASLDCAMGYFSVAGIAAAYQNPQYCNSVATGVGTLDYGVMYDEVLRRNAYMLTDSACLTLYRQSMPDMNVAWNRQCISYMAVGPK